MDFSNVKKWLIGGVEVKKVVRVLDSTVLWQAIQRVLKEWRGLSPLTCTPTVDDVFEEVKVYGDSVQNPIRTRNLFDKDSTPLDAYVTGQGMFAHNTCKTWVIEVKPNSTYTLSYNNSMIGSNPRCYIIGFENKPAIGSTDATMYYMGLSAEKHTVTFTTGSNVNYIALWLVHTLATAGTQEALSTAQLEEGTQATPYVPYIATVPTPDTPIPVESVGDKQLLPYGYTQLEYIESTGTQYIDTGLYFNQDTSVELKIKLNRVTANSGLYGAYNAYSNRYENFIHGSLRYEAGYGSNYVQQGIPDTNIHTLYQNKNQFYVDDTLISTLGDYGRTFTSGLTAYIGHFHINNSQYKPLIGNIYSAKIWDNDTLIQDLIPAKRNSDNVLGMYDTVSNTFLTNAGTGDFIAGDEVAQGGYKVPIQVSGNLYKDTYLYAPAQCSPMSLKKGIYTMSVANDDSPSKGKAWYVRLYKDGNVVTERGHLTSPQGTFNFSTSSYNYYGLEGYNTGISFIIDDDYDVQVGKLNANRTIKLMVNVGATPLPYVTPTTNIYLPEPLRKVGEYSDTMSVVDIKNVFNKDDLVQGTYTSDTTPNRINTKLNLINGVSYKVSNIGSYQVYLLWYNKGTTTQAGTSGIWYEYSFEISNPNTDLYDYILIIRKSDNTNLTPSSFDGDIKVTNFLNVTVTRNVGAVDFGNSNFGGYESQFNRCMVSGISNAKVFDIRAGYGLSTALSIYKGSASASSVPMNCFYWGNRTNVIFVTEDVLKDSTLIKRKLTGQYLYYQLATPTTETYSIEPINALDNTSIITVDTTTPPSEIYASEWVEE